MLFQRAVRRLVAARKLLLPISAVLLVMIAGSAQAAQTPAQPQTQTPAPAAAPAAQTPAQTPAPDQTPASKTGIEGTWQGTLHIPTGGSLRTVLKITRTPAGALSATFYSIDQGGQGIPTSSISFDAGTLKYAIQFIDLTYQGKMSADNNSITGSSTQGGNALPLVFERATPETAWTIPEPPPRLPPMAADADPSFQVATIKPTKPDEQRKLLVVRGREFMTVNLTVADLIKFAYDVQEKQIAGAPDWVMSEKYDINAQPDVPGTPNSEQLKIMIRKLLADRFQLKFHKDQKEMSAYVLTVGEKGPKMTKETNNPNNLPGLFFGPIGTLHVTNATMADFTHLMQSAVLDRPVADHTGLDGRWSFVLKWTPDETQFAGMGIKVPPSTDTADAAPPLFTAIQEQLDLKLEAQKAPVDVVTLDHIDRPTPN